MLATGVTETLEAVEEAWNPKSEEGTPRVLATAGVTEPLGAVEKGACCPSPEWEAAERSNLPAFIVAANLVCLSPMLKVGDQELK